MVQALLCHTALENIKEGSRLADPRRKTLKSLSSFLAVPPDQGQHTVHYTESPWLIPQQSEGWSAANSLVLLTHTNCSDWSVPPAEEPSLLARTVQLWVCADVESWGRVFSRSPSLSVAHSILEQSQGQILSREKRSLCLKVIFNCSDIGILNPS